MVFYVYFDPALISAAEGEGAMGLSCLLGIVRGLEENCCLAEFDDWHVQEEIKDNVTQLEKRLPDLDGKSRAQLAEFLKCLKALFATLAKRNRFIYCLTSKGESPDLRVAAVLRQSKGAELDLVLAENVDKHPNPDNLSSATLMDYNATPFAANRAHLASKGIISPPGEHAEQDFLDKSLRKALKHSCAIHIYDEVMGKRWGDNFEYTVKTLLGWLERFIVQPGKCNLHLYCGKPPGFADQHIKTQVGSFRRGRLANLSITIHFHETLSGMDTMPHDRFLLTDQFAIEIGRGMDFLDRKTRRNRDASVNLKDLTGLSNFLKTAANSSLPSVSC